MISISPVIGFGSHSLRSLPAAAAVDLREIKRVMNLWEIHSFTQLHTAALSDVVTAQHTCTRTPTHTHACGHTSTHMHTHSLYEIEIITLSKQ